MLLLEKLRLFASIVPFVITHSLRLLYQSVTAFIHKRTYKSLPLSDVKNVVVIGGSFAGWQLAKRLTHTLPTGYRVVLVEKNSHLNYLFAFPRFSVIGGHERFAFIPYLGIANKAPRGIFDHIQETAVGIDDKKVTLESGREVDYAYLAIATGTSSSLPSKLSSTSNEGGIHELIDMQRKIAEAKKIAVVGGGAVGIELASDIKDFYPEKEIALIHSHDQLLPSFGARLHEHTMRIFNELGIAVLLNERPRLPTDGSELTFLNGKVEHFDLVIPCTGQTPNSAILASLSHVSISTTTNRIVVQPTLQLMDTNYPHVFAFGDVAETGGPRMARAAYFQSEVVSHNILGLLGGKNTQLKEYAPRSFEGSIKLTLGKTRNVLYTREESGREILIPMNNGLIDLGVKKQWGFFGADIKTLD